MDSHKNADLRVGVFVAPLGNMRLRLPLSPGWILKLESLLAFVI
jgi:hypothetical protein